MSNFALDTGSSQGDIISSLNYALANLGTQTIDGNVVINIVGNVLANANVVTANTVTGQLQSNAAGTISYLYNYVNVKYANSATGSSGFSSNSTGASYYGVHNTTNGTISTNPVDYQWRQVAGGFGTTKGLYYTTAGGGQIYFSATTTPPTVNYQPVLDDTPILLQSLANSIVVTTSINPGAVTNVSIAANTITSQNIGTGQVNALNVAARTLTQAQIALNSITGNTITQSTLTGNLIALNTITGNLVAQNTITGNLIVPGTITGNLIQANTVITSTLASSGVTPGVTSGYGFWLTSNVGDAYFGGNVNIGQNLYVQGLITSANLNSNTVATTTMVPNSATQTAGYQGTAFQILNPPVGYAGFDGQYYSYESANVVPVGVALSCTTNNVVNVISGYIDVYGNTSIPAGTSVVPQMYGTLYRIIGSNVTVVSGTFTSTPAAYSYPGPQYVSTTQTTLPVRLSEVSIVDVFTLPSPPTLVEYIWVYGAILSCTANVAPSQPFIDINGYSLTITNYKR